MEIRRGKEKGGRRDWGTEEREGTGRKSGLGKRREWGGGEGGRRGRGEDGGRGVNSKCQLSQIPCRLFYLLFISSKHLCIAL